ncbi:MAG: type I restriction enzyme HsdR N-terminal domain-containing protein [Simkaniaceae bacterium]|nr:type I restriction enzyme HsdR N-terminal domain-containing protein [Simkaniaceae bacterium]
MVSSTQNKKIYDPIRKKWVMAIPEELVRQKILHLLTHELGYPPQAIAIEKKLSELPHLQQIEVPIRRLDILCCETKTLCPLLLIECKRTPLQQKMFAQLMGYNAFIKAPLICLANDREFLLGWEGPKRAMSLDRLPNYKELCDETSRMGETKIP